MTQDEQPTNVPTGDAVEDTCVHCGVRILQVTLGELSMWVHVPSEGPVYLLVQCSLVASPDGENLRARLDEAEEKIASLESGCLRMTRDELIQRITAVGPARYKAGVYWAERDAKARAAGMAEQREKDAQIALAYNKGYRLLPDDAAVDTAKARIAAEIRESGS